MNRMFFVFGLFLVFVFFGCVEDGSNDGSASIDEIGSDGVDNNTPPFSGNRTIDINLENDTNKIDFTAYYIPGRLDMEPSVPQYQLPLDLSLIYNYDDVNRRLNLNEDQNTKLEQNGFVIIDWGGDSITDPYNSLKWQEVPIFITSDTVLHLYHIQFNEILLGIEDEEFFESLKAISKAMMDDSLAEYETRPEGDLKEAAKRNVAYFGVGLKLLEPDADIPDIAIGTVDEEIALINAHSGFTDSPLFGYSEDYSQYVPRGHYTRSEKLEKFFRSMMWYGRMTFLVKEGYVSEDEAKIQTLQAILISSRAGSVQAGGQNVLERWERIYEVTAFFVGLADDLTLYEYRDGIISVYGNQSESPNLDDGQKLLEFKADIAQMRKPQIYGGTGACEVDELSEEEINRCFDDSQGFRFMGQRFIPDSYMMQNLVALPYTGTGEPFTKVDSDLGAIRGFPRGLDVMAILGSERAEQILRQEGDTEYVGYDEALSQLKQEFDQLNVSEWNRNLYWGWLYSLKPLLTNFSSGYPTFMQTEAWQNKELRTSLASWAELRHDTILYAKQSYTVGIVSLPRELEPVVGYVEPVPEFYNRMYSLTEMTEQGLDDLNVLNDSSRAKLQSLKSMLGRLREMSIKELENEELTEDDYRYINDFGETLDEIVGGVDAEGKETTMVADVHTDMNSGMVLEEGVGKVELVVVAYKVPDGRILVGAGPVLSYYEFKQPMANRLNNDQWKEMLNDNPPEIPEWVNGIYSRDSG